MSPGARGQHLLDEKRRILAAALPHVPFDGWSGGLMTRAAAEAGYDASMALRAFPRGPADLVDFWIAETDRRMLEAFAARGGEAMRVRDRIALAVRLRLEHLTPQREAVRRALALQALPQNAPLALAALYRTVDAIWQAAGDTATDWNFYSKRLLLAGVYGATLLFWIDDRSDGQAETWAFLDRRIAEVMEIQKLRGRVEQVLAGLPERFAALRRRR